MINILIVIGFGIFCFVLGQLSMYPILRLYQRMEKIYEELREIDQEKFKCEHGFENWDDCPVCGH